jgi:subtilase family serine protease
MLKPLTLCCLWLICAATLSAGNASAAPPPAQPITASTRTDIGYVPEAVTTKTAALLKPLDTTAKIRFSIILRLPHQKDLEQRVANMLDPHSATFHHFLSFADWKAQYAPADTDIQAVSDWSKSNGFTEIHRFPTNHILVVEGTIAQTQRALGLTLNQYKFAGQTYFSNDRRPSIPIAMNTSIGNILGLNSFDTVHPNTGAAAPAQAVPRAITGAFITTTTFGQDASQQNPPMSAILPNKPHSVTKRPDFTGPMHFGLLEPSDIQSQYAYNFLPLGFLSQCCNPTNAPSGSPKETSLAVIGENKPLFSDVAFFQAAYNLASNITEVQISGPQCCDLEMTLDIEWAGASSNGFSTRANTAHLYVYEGGGSLYSDLLDAWEQAFSDDKARVASTSFGGAEGNINPVLGFGPSVSDFHDITTQMVALGWTLVAASGDRGAYEICKKISIQYPGSDPNVIAVGGTDLVLNYNNATNALSFGSEQAWNGNGCLAGGINNGGGGGGGCSQTFFEPVWAHGSGACPNSRRATPDMSLNAQTSQSLYYGGAWTTAGGTSIAAPELAGFFVQANSYRVALGLAGAICGPAHNAVCGPIGHPGPALYAAPGSAPHNPFYDITIGCNGGGYGTGDCAGPGYDKATGLGSANMLQLAWAINYFIDSPGASRPVVNFNGPPPGTWSTGDQVLTIVTSGATMGIAGFTAQWDTDPGDPVSHITPGTGDPFWNGPATIGTTTGTLHLTSVPAGCHTAYVRAWDNLGQSALASYGPLCRGPLAGCQIGLNCPLPVHAPPDYAVTCPANADFYNSFSDGTKSYLSTGLSVSGETTTYLGGILACNPGTTSCSSFSTYAPVTEWCSAGGTTPPGHGPPGNPKTCCMMCIKAGGYCTPQAKGCLCQ